MGSLEIESKKRSRNHFLKEAILQTVSAVGIIGVGLIAPKVLGMMVKSGIVKTSRQREIIENSRKRLINQGLLEYSKKGFLCLTDEGKHVLELFERRHYVVNIPKKWDKKWRVLIFDIQEKKRHTRDKVRNTLRAIGFCRLQNSVWVYPYDCEDLITLLKADFKIGKDLLYLIVDSIENDKKLKDHFDL